MSETVKCPYCAETIQADAKKCRHCSEWLPAEAAAEATPSQVADAPKSSSGISWGWMFAFIAFAGLWHWIGSSGQSTPQGDSAPSAAAAVQDKRVTEIGGEGILRGSPLVEGGRGTIVILGKTEDDFSAFVKANVADDKRGMEELLLAGRIFTVPSGKARAKKIDSNWTGAIQVRLLSGERANEAGWTAMECLEK